MIEIRYAPEFKQRYAELPLPIRKKVERREEVFRSNPFHPSLQTEKLEPRNKEYWSFRIDRDYRIIFRFKSDGKILLITCGHHSWIYNYILTH